VADVRLVHFLHGRLVVLVHVGDDEPRGHDIGEVGLGRVEPAVDDLPDDVALGEDPAEPVTVENGDDADVVGRMVRTASATVALRWIVNRKPWRMMSRSRFIADTSSDPGRSLLGEVAECTAFRGASP